MTPLRASSWFGIASRLGIASWFGIVSPLGIVSWLAGSGLGTGTDEEPRSRPEQGIVLLKRWSEELALELDSFEQTIGGNPVEVSFANVRLASRRELEVSDEYVRVGEERVEELLRRFESSAQSFALEMGAERLGSFEGGTLVDGGAVRFTWDEGRAAYARERASEELALGDLDGLDPDLDLAGLLPPVGLEPGAAFEPPLGSLRPFFAAGGDLGLTGEVRSGEELIPRQVIGGCALGSLRALFGPECELGGTARARCAVDEQASEGRRLARIEVELELTSSADLSPTFAGLARQISDVPGECALRFEGELDGTLVLLWDLEQRRLASCRYEGAVSFAGELSFPLAVEGGTDLLPLVIEYEVSGDATVALEVDAP